MERGVHIVWKAGHNIVGLCALIATIRREEDESFCWNMYETKYLWSHSVLKPPAGMSGTRAEDHPSFNHHFVFLGAALRASYRILIYRYHDENLSTRPPT
jgi:hypothetical protein